MLKAAKTVIGCKKARFPTPKYSLLRKDVMIYKCFISLYYERLIWYVYFFNNSVSYPTRLRPFCVSINIQWKLIAYLASIKTILHRRYAFCTIIRQLIWKKYISCTKSIKKQTCYERYIFKVFLLHIRLNLDLRMTPVINYT